MKKTLIFFTLILFLIIRAQTAPPVTWQKLYGGSSEDVARSTQQTTDGGYIFAGSTYSSDGDVSSNKGYSDYWIVKTNSDGIITWQKNYGGKYEDVGESIQQTSDGGYIVAGSSKSSDQDITNHHGSIVFADYWIIKLDNLGNLIWQKSFGGSGGDYAKSVKQTRDGGYIVVGYSASNDGDVIGHHGANTKYDYWVIKLNSTGNLVWQKSLGGTDNDTAASVQQTLDNGYIISGSTWSYNGDVTFNRGNSDVWIVKLDEAGNMIWQKTYGGSLGESANAIQQTSDGGYIFAGASSSYNGDVTINYGGINDFWVVKLDVAGNLQWQKSLGGAHEDYANSVEQTKDGGYIIGGISRSSDGMVGGHHGINTFADYWIAKLNGNGILKWQNSFGDFWHDNAYSVQQTSDEGYIIAGGSQKYDGTSTVGYYDFLVIKLGADFLATNETETLNFAVYPNPVKDILNFSEEVSNIRIIDVSGKVVKQISDSVISINLIRLSKGNYIVTATTKSRELISKKIIKH